jgi:hypothetical protein
VSDEKKEEIKIQNKNMSAKKILNLDIEDEN